MNIFNKTVIRNFQFSSYFPSTYPIIPKYDLMLTIKIMSMYTFSHQKIILFRMIFEEIIRRYFFSRKKKKLLFEDFIQRNR